jgi:GTP-binding protein EngB required for normal cell division
MMNVYVWLQNGQMYKAILDTEAKLFVVFDKDDKILERRTNLSQRMIKKIKEEFEKYVVKKHKPNFSAFFDLMIF